MKPKLTILCVAIFALCGCRATLPERVAVIFNASGDDVIVTSGLSHSEVSLPSGKERRIHCAEGLTLEKKDGGRRIWQCSQEELDALSRMKMTELTTESGLRFGGECTLRQYEVWHFKFDGEELWLLGKVYSQPVHRIPFKKEGGSRQ